MHPRLIYPDGLPTPMRYWAMLSIAIGITVCVLDTAVVNIALPAIGRQLQIDRAEAVWIVNAYQLAILATLLPLASLGERIGYRRVYIAGLALFTAASLGCAWSHSLRALVTARAIQGLGAGAVMSVNGALVRFTYPRAMLGRGVGLNAMVVAIAASLGPTIAAAILAVGRWEWLFAVNVPIGIANIALAVRALPQSERSGRRFDRIGTALNALAFGLLFIGIDALARGSGDRLVACLELLAGLSAGGLLIRRGMHAEAPLIPIDLLRIPLFGLSVATSVCSFAAYMLGFIALPFYFETALHLGQVQTGLLMTAWPAALGLAAAWAGRLSDRMPAAILGAGGLLVMAAGLLLLAALPADPANEAIIWRMALCGLGFGFFQAPNNRTMLSSAPRARAGAAGGMLATARLLGMTAGAAIAAFWFARLPHAAETACLLTGAVLAAIAACISLMRLAKRLPDQTARRPATQTSTTRQSGSITTKSARRRGSRRPRSARPR